jgi:hypothetical protein
VAAHDDSPYTMVRVREMTSAHVRTFLLLRALRSVYAAMGGFGSATLLSLVGVVFASQLAETPGRLLELGSLVAGVVGVGGVLWAAVLLVRETRIAVGSFRERVEAQERRFDVEIPGAGGRA